MKVILASAAVALLPTAALADEGNTDLDGFVSVSAGYNSLEQGDYSYDYTYGSGSGTSNYKVQGLDTEARATGAFPITGSLAAQVDGIFSRTYYKTANCGGCTRYHSDDSTVAAHIFVRSPSKGLIGIFGQRSTQTYSGYTGVTTFYGGAEVKAYLGRVSFGGQMAYGTIDYNSNTSYKINGPWAAMKFRYFPSNDLSFELRGEHGQLKQSPNANAGYACPDYCYSNKTSMWDIGGKSEFRFHNSRFSLFAEADYRDFRNVYHYVDYPSYYSRNNQASSGWRAMAGIKVNFGSQSLYARDRSGAALDPVRPFSANSANFEN